MATADSQTTQPIGASQLATLTLTLLTAVGGALIILTEPANTVVTACYGVFGIILLGNRLAHHRTRALDLPEYYRANHGRHVFADMVVGTYLIVFGAFALHAFAVVSTTPTTIYYVAGGIAVGFTAFFSISATSAVLNEANS